MSVSVLILARNEEVNLPRCLGSVRWSDDIVVLDDGSTDKTAEIARRSGVRVVCHSAGGENEQRTYSLRKIPFRYPWVYNPDADEETPEDLRDEILQVVADTSRPEVAYRVRFKMMFQGKWIRHSSLYPTWVMRLFRPEKITFERTTNLRYVANGPVGFLQSHFIHYTFSKGMDAWWEKHIRYASLEAKESIHLLQCDPPSLKGVFSADPVERRRNLKDLSTYLPFRPALRFLYMYFWRMGFLDGTPGFTYCRMMSRYERMIVQNMEEIRRREGAAGVRPL